MAAALLDPVLSFGSLTHSLSVALIEGWGGEESPPHQQPRTHHVFTHNRLLQPLLGLFMDLSEMERNGSKQC